MSGNPEVPGVYDFAEASEVPQVRVGSEAAESSVISGGHMRNPAESPEAPGRPAHKARRARRAAAIAGSALLACAVLGGVGYTVVTVRDADRAPGRPTWKYPAARGRDGKDDGKNGRKTEKSASGLSGMLLPFGTDGYSQGPDLGEFGPDADFNGARATALRKETLKDLPTSTRRDLEKLIDEQHIRGLAMRSYTVTPGTSADENSVSASVTLLRLENRNAVRQMSTSLNYFLDATDILRKGPDIKGHKGTHCFSTPKGEKNGLGLAFCASYVGDVLVRVNASGPGPIDADLTAKFFSAQLDRIKDPGLAV